MILIGKELHQMREGRLGYNSRNGRYGLLAMDLWLDTGFHCGECLEVMVAVSYTHLTLPTTHTV